jgi:predicted nucleic acid-binding protein
VIAVPGYLLDLNHAHAIFHQKPRVMQHLRTLPQDAQLRLCTITLGEIEAGFLMTFSGNPERRLAYAKDIADKYHSNALPVRLSTRLKYAQIIGRIWKHHPPKDKGDGTEEHLLSLKVDVNDVWTTAVAWDHGLTFVTADRMRVIREVIRKDELNFENWDQ